MQWREITAIAVENQGPMVPFRSSADVHSALAYVSSTFIYGSTMDGHGTLHSKDIKYWIAFGAV